MTEQNKDATGEASQNKDDALASFNKEFEALQVKYKLKVIGVPSINAMLGTIEATVQVIDLASLPKESVEEKVTE